MSFGPARAAGPAILGINNMFGSVVPAVVTVSCPEDKQEISCWQERAEVKQRLCSATSAFAESKEFLFSLVHLLVLTFSVLPHLGGTAIGSAGTEITSPGAMREFATFCLVTGG